MTRLLGLVLLTGSHVLAQQQAAPDGTIQALLAEVRQLRIAMEKSAVLAPKIQMTLQRMQLQQTVVINASRELEGVRNQLSGIPAEVSQLTSALKEMESASPHDKAQEREIRMLKERIDQRRGEETQLRARESEVAGKLQSEQGKLDELGGKLNAYERALDQR